MDKIKIKAKHEYSCLNLHVGYGQVKRSAPGHCCFVAEWYLNGKKVAEGESYNRGIAMSKASERLGHYLETHDSAMAWSGDCRWDAGDEHTWHDRS